MPRKKRWTAALLVVPWILVGIVVVPLAFAYVLAVIALNVMARIVVRLVVELAWGWTGRRVLLVYSRSPVWQAYIEANWLPRLENRAIVLDWSNRSTWKFMRPFAATVFRLWSPGHDFNPSAYLIPTLRPVKHIGFHEAFRDWKHGNTAALEAAEERLFSFLEPDQMNDRGHR